MNRIVAVEVSATGGTMFNHLTFDGFTIFPELLTRNLQCECAEVLSFISSILSCTGWTI